MLSTANDQLKKAAFFFRTYFQLAPVTLFFRQGGLHSCISNSSAKSIIIHAPSHFPEFQLYALSVFSPSLWELVKQTPSLCFKNVNHNMKRYKDKILISACNSLPSFCRLFQKYSQSSEESMSPLQKHVSS